MRTSPFVGLWVALGLALSAAPARADCAAPPASCYCRTAAAAVDAHVETILADRVTVRVDAVTASASPSPLAPTVGSSVDITTNDLWGAVPIVGDRILAAYDSNGQVIAPALIVAADGQVSCETEVLPVAETAELWVMEDSACRDAVDQRFGEYECDDTRSSCAVDSRPASGWAVITALLSAMSIRLLRRKRSRLT